MREIALTQEEIGVLIDLLEKRKEEIRKDEGAVYVRTLIKQILEKLDSGD